jgi:predicted transcriptional regulator
VAQKVKYSLPEDGIVLPKHVGAIVKEKLKNYIIQCI